MTICVKGNSKRCPSFLQNVSFCMKIYKSILRSFYLSIRIVVLLSIAFSHMLKLFAFSLNMVGYSFFCLNEPVIIEVIYHYQVKELDTVNLNWSIYIGLSIGVCTM